MQSQRACEPKNDDACHVVPSRSKEEMLVGTYVKERDNNRMKGGETGVVFWSKVYCLSMRDMGEAHILYINGR